MQKSLFLYFALLFATVVMAQTSKTTDFSGLLNYPCHRINAKLDGRTPVNIIFQRGEDRLLAGYIYYPKASKPAPIMILGNVFNIEGKDYYYFSEYQSDGVITGHISLILNEGDFSSGEVEGTWTNPKTGKEFKLTELSWSHEIPEWFTESLLIPEDPGNIGVRYSFQEWDIYAQQMAGGHITFSAAGKNKVHFECCNARHNIAEGRSTAGRPAVLHGNTFEYHEVNECHYAFRATFYSRFVRLTSISDTPTSGCFGSGAAFDGIYIKVKQ